MKLFGLWPKHKINRPLSENEKAGKLNQIKWQDQPFSDLIFNGFEGVIRLNSTYLEVADRHYLWKGFGMSFMLYSLIFFTVLPIMLLSVTNPNTIKGAIDIFIIIVVFLLNIIMLGFTIFFLLKEFFRWTHYPIRFNRKNRRVYIFGYDGKIRRAKWERIFFTVRTDLKDVFKSNYIFGHILSDDRKTVLYTFTLPIETLGTSSSEGLHWYWNFLCNYMNGDIADNVAVMRVCPPIEGRKEGFFYGLYHCANMGGGYWPILLFTFPLVIPMALTRYLVMLTCKIPKWSDEVEVVCKIEDDDPINLSAATNPKSLLHTFRVPNKAERKAFLDRTDALRAKMDAQISKEKRKQHISIQDLLQ